MKSITNEKRQEMLRRVLEIEAQLKEGSGIPIDLEHWELWINGDIRDILKTRKKLINELTADDERITSRCRELHERMKRKLSETYESLKNSTHEAIANSEITRFQGSFGYRVVPPIPHDEEGVIYGSSCHCIKVLPDVDKDYPLDYQYMLRLCALTHPYVAVLIADSETGESIQMRDNKSTCLSKFELAHLTKLQMYHHFTVNVNEEF